MGEREGGGGWGRPSALLSNIRLGQLQLISRDFPFAKLLNVHTSLLSRMCAGEEPQRTRYAEPMLDNFWPTVYDAGQH